MAHPDFLGSFNGKDLLFLSHKYETQIIIFGSLIKYPVMHCDSKRSLVILAEDARFELALPFNG